MYSSKPPVNTKTSGWALWHILRKEGEEAPRVKYAAEELDKILTTNLSSVLQTNNTARHLTLEDGKVFLAGRNIQAVLEEKYAYGWGRILGNLLVEEIARGRVQSSVLEEYKKTDAANDVEKNILDMPLGTVLYLCVKQEAERRKKERSLTFTTAKLEVVNGGADKPLIRLLFEKIILQSNVAYTSAGSDFGFSTLVDTTSISIPFFFRKIKDGSNSGKTALAVLREPKYQEGWRFSGSEDESDKPLGARLEATIQDEIIRQTNVEVLKERIENILHLIAGISNKSLFGKNLGQFPNDMGVTRQAIQNYFKSGSKLALTHERLCDLERGWLSKMRRNSEYTYALNLILPGCKKPLGELLEAAAHDLPKRNLSGRPRKVRVESAKGNGASV